MSRAFAFGMLAEAHPLGGVAAASDSTVINFKNPSIVKLKREEET